MHPLTISACIDAGCGHCKALTPEYDQASLELEGKNAGVLAKGALKLLPMPSHHDLNLTTLFLLLACTLQLTAPSSVTSAMARTFRASRPSSCSVTTAASQLTTTRPERLMPLSSTWFGT